MLNWGLPHHQCPDLLLFQLVSIQKVSMTVQSGKKGGHTLFPSNNLNCDAFSMIVLMEMIIYKQDI